ncbi:CRAL/TRIO domain-containing protein [Pluteus cervinus]|uniref:CRAL/TRIO domain-containing protein n=1 Tax=Pluteus cervinus TaxID=181527 RepID=A0ACD3AKT3_9AGAR|nr:CRAL/TRIO domain-containing protein [Pluteus cervinus]
MATEIRELLEANCLRLLEQYQQHIDEVRVLQDTLVRDILPSVVDELQLSPEAAEWARESLLDTSFLFRIARRNNFTRSLAMESVRRTLLWRMSCLWPSAVPAPVMPPNLHCLPVNIRDPLGRPIIILRATSFAGDDVDSSKLIVLQVAERLRVHLHSFTLASDSGYASESEMEIAQKDYGTSASARHLALQYMVILDLKNLSMQTLSIDLITWILREVMPRFPGMLAGVIMINYSWTHSGLWGFIKRLLPASALSRVFFPTQDQLLQYFTPSVLPKDYGGTLPFLVELRDPLRANEPSPPLTPPIDSNSDVENGQLTPTATSNPPITFDVSSSSPSLTRGRSRVLKTPSTKLQSQASWSATSPDAASTTPAADSHTSRTTLGLTPIAPTSTLNPYFGYPATTSLHGTGPPSLRHGRRRRRDLFRTLMQLLWIRWGSRFTLFSIWIALVSVVVWALRRRGVLVRAPKLVGWGSAMVSSSR